MVKVASFDVFETLLVRCLGDHGNVPTLLGRSIERDPTISLPSTYAPARLAAERRARRRVGPDRDPTLVGIYQELAASLRLDADVERDLLTRELQFEEEALRPNPIAIERLAAVRTSGHRIYFTSDTYLPSTFVERQLRAHGFWEAGDTLLVSCEHAGTKRAGSLFMTLASVADVPPASIVHIGNDRTSDVLAARRAGLRTRYVDEANLSVDEQTLDAHAASTEGLATVLAGAARLSRLGDGEPPVTSVLRDVAADIAAPTLVGYVLWVLEEARRQELSAIYFLSREGQVLHDIARILVDRLELPIEVRYLYASRQSLNLASLTGFERPELAWVLTHAETNTVRRLLGRLGIRPEDVRTELTQVGLPVSSWDRVPEQAARDRLLDALSTGRLQGIARERVEQARRRATGYLEQEGFLSTERCGVVDVSGVGSQFRALSVLRRLAGKGGAPAFLFVRSRDPYLEAEGGYGAVEQPVIHAYFEDGLQQTGEGPTPGLTQLLEVFCAADHGTVTDYEHHGESFVPTLTDESATPVIEWGLPEVRAAIDEVTRHLWIDDRYVNLRADLRPALRELLSRFWSSPTRREAEVWAAHPFEATTGRDDPEPLATGWTVRELLGALRGGLESRHWFHWRAASTELSPVPVRFVLRSAREARPLLRRFKRRR